MWSIGLSMEFVFISKFFGWIEIWHNKRDSLEWNLKKSLFCWICVFHFFCWWLRTFPVLESDSSGASEKTKKENGSSTNLVHFINIFDNIQFPAIHAVSKNTVKLGYNELGYNELGYNKHSVITNKLCGPNGHFAI